MDAIAARAGIVRLPPSRLGPAATRLATLGVAAVPLALGVGRFWTLYLTPGSDLWSQYRSLALYPVDLVVVIVCLGWLVGRRRQGAPMIRPAAAGVTFALAALAVVAAASARTALDPVLALGTAVHLAVLALFFAAATDIAARGSRGPIIGGICAAVLAQSALAIWQAATQSTAPAGALFNGWPAEFAAADRAASVAALPGVDRWLRSYGSFPHPNILGIFLAGTLIVLVAMPNGRSRWRTLALGAGLAAVGLSFSRTAWLALALGVGMLLVATRGGRSRDATHQPDPRVTGIALALVLLGGVVIGARLIRVDAFTERNSLTARALYDAAGWALVDRGVAVGAGNIVLAEQTVAPPGLIGEPPHDVFLIALAELGPLGPAGLILLLAGLVAAARSARGSGPVAAAVLLVPVLFFDHYLWTQPPGGVLLVWSCAMLVGMSAGAPAARPKAVEAGGAGWPDRGRRAS